MKVILAGSRTVTEPEMVERAILESGFEITEVVCGEARGVDTLGREWAERHKISVASFPARWRPDGPTGRVDTQAGFKRNVQMAEYADALIAVWDGKSRGTKHMIEIAEARKLDVHVEYVGRIVCGQPPFSFAKP